MDFDAFSAERERRRAFAFAEGFNNGDPETNGEFAALDALMGSCDVLLDVGANAGLFSERALRARPDARVLALEPNPQHHEELARRLGDRGALLSAAASEAEGEAVLSVHPGHPGSASLGDRRLMSQTFRDGLKPLKVRTVRLDALPLPLPAPRGVFIKIDVEGYEAKVIRGARGLLEARGRAVAALFEYSFGWLETEERFSDCFDLLQELGFGVFRLTPFGLEEIRFTTPDHALVQYCNYLALRDVNLEGFHETRIATPLGSNRFLRFPARDQG